MNLNIVKKAFFLFVIAVFLFSCSSESDGYKDPSIGSWSLMGVTLLLNDGTVMDVELTCEVATYLSLHNDGGVNFQLHAYDEEFNGCYSHITANKAYWTKISENKYFIEMKFHYTHPYLLDPGEYYEEGEITFSLDVSFPEDKVMHVYNQELFGLFPAEIYGENVASYYVVYKDKTGEWIAPF